MNDLASLVKEFLGEKEFGKVLSQPIIHNLKTNSISRPNLQNDVARSVEQMIVDSSDLNEEAFNEAFLEEFHISKKKQQSPKTEEEVETEKGQEQEQEQEQVQTKNIFQSKNEESFFEKEVILDFLMKPLSLDDPMNRENPSMGVVIYNHFKTVIKTSQKNGSLVSRYQLNDGINESFVRKGNCSRDLAEWIFGRHFFNPEFQKQKRKRGRKNIQSNSQKSLLKKKYFIHLSGKNNSSSIIKKRPMILKKKLLPKKKYDL
ncbi:hypothetical protein M0813_01716 [Anaeramoeba flamelloides]|uniref:Uncharacterized protein n=1 Tax=Anaeramoeba flamelloides TaxID=1746091 RepID=A0ABQ8YXC2_9EUKA|nr:hypothetical protein M0813_01716 [Anaeramoeba flamelloides]